MSFSSHCFFPTAFEAACCCVFVIAACGLILILILRFFPQSREPNALVDKEEAFKDVEIETTF